MERVCRVSGKKFEIASEDLEFYKKMSVPLPTLCPEERSRRRMAWRNERHLYKNISRVTGKEIISVFAPDSGYHTCEPNIWYTDEIDNSKYGRDFNFSRSFFEQFNDLLHDITLPALVNINTVNSDYGQYVDGARNCYLIFASDNCEDCYYVSYIWECKNCVDCYGLLKCELCYECLDCRNSYRTIYSQFCMQCSDCAFCFDCKSCEYCFGSSGLRHKKYVFFNEELTREEYEKRMKEIYPLTEEKIKEYADRAYRLSLKIPRKFAQILKCENSTGDFLTNCKNCAECYDCYDDEECKYVFNGPKNNKFCYDCTGIHGGELIYEGVVCGISGYNNAYSVLCIGCENLRYCYNNINSKNLFGCAGLKRSQYCILNKQYSKEEYEKMIPRIIEHMKKYNEWGEFFPGKYSPYPYNDTIAQEYFPIDEKTAAEMDFKWRKKDETPKLPDMTNMPKCASCKKPYNIIQQELNFYKTFGLPTPTLCHNCRYDIRFNKRNPKKLWERSCAKCATKILTTYAPERPETVYCDKCYTEMLY